MTDIVERLDDAVNKFYGQEPASLLDEAKREITRLRAIEQAALAAYRHHMTGYGKEPGDFNANKMLDLMNELGAAL